MVTPASSPGIHAIDRVVAVKTVAQHGDTPEVVASALPQLIKGHLYHAKILEISADGSLKINIEGRQIDLSMGQIFTAGQAIVLKYLGEASTPAFLLMPDRGEVIANTSLSPTARQIDAHLRLAEQQGAANIYEASIPATLTPHNAQQLAADLQHTLASSGLFYESHLADFAEGSRPLASLMQEPQNKGGPISNHLLAQQLSVLESQRVLWHGEIWPRQLADWRIDVDDSNRRADTQEHSETAMSSSVTLQLPRLGKVTARLSLAEGKIKVTLLADQSSTATELQGQAAPLVHALQRNVSVLEGFSIVHKNDHE